MKMDSHNLVKRGLHCDDIIPDEQRSIWTSHFALMKEIANLKFHRAIIPADAVNLKIHTSDNADASNQIACAAIYAIFLRRNGSVHVS